MDNNAEIIQSLVQARDVAIASKESVVRARRLSFVREFAVIAVPLIRGRRFRSGLVALPTESGRDLICSPISPREAP
jgi:hypothetical protein